LLIPGENDSDGELHELAEWVAGSLGEDVPLHFTAFHPDFKMRDRPATPPATLTRAREIALSKGIRYVYTGNVHDAPGSSTYCPECKDLVIERDWYELGAYNLDKSCCASCGHEIAGRFSPEGKGNWGRKRMAVRLGEEL
jgi:pyruvate formate lyase activating enzyme